MPDTTQDTATCVICGDPLTHKPRLGEWIAHDRCRDAVQIRAQEAEARGMRLGERAAMAGLHGGRVRGAGKVGDQRDGGAMRAQTVTISGASDDIVSIDPAIGGLDEIGCYDSDVSLVVTGDEGGCRVIMRYGKHGGVWGAEIVPLDDGHPMPPIRVELGGRGYSAAVTIEGVRHITHEEAPDAKRTDSGQQAAWTPGPQTQKETKQ